MNARIQRILFLARLAAGLGVGWWFGWAWGLLAAFIYPVLLGPSFAVTRWVNRGLGGQTTSQVLHRYPIDVAPLKPAVVVLVVGVNDLRMIAAEGTGFDADWSNKTEAARQ